MQLGAVHAQVHLNFARQRTTMLRVHEWKNEYFNTWAVSWSLEAGLWTLPALSNGAGLVQDSACHNSR